MKTIRRLPTRLVLETEAGLVSQRLWYRLGRRQDTSELELTNTIFSRCIPKSMRLVDRKLHRSGRFDVLILPGGFILILATGVPCVFALTGKTEPGPLRSYGVRSLYLG
jgi:hypothetical protein